MNKNIVFIGVILSTLFWGSNFNAGSFVVSHMSPVLAAAERFTIASIVILIYMLCKEKGSLAVLRKNFVPFMVLGILGITGFNLALFFGLKTTTATNGALIMATSPLVTAVIAALLDRTKIGLYQRLGMTISLVGVLFVISKGSLDNITNLRFTIGDLIILGGNICWAAYTVGCRKFITDSTPLQTTTFTMLFGSLGILITALFTEHDIINTLINSPASTHLALVYMGIAGSVLAYLFWNVGLHRLGVANTSIFFNLVPVFTMVITAAYGSYPNSLQIGGAVLVITGVIVATGTYRVILEKFAPVKV